MKPEIQKKQTYLTQAPSATSLTFFSRWGVGANTIRYSETGFIGFLSAVSFATNLAIAPVIAPANLIQLAHLACIGLPICISHYQYCERSGSYSSKIMQKIAALLKSQRLFFAAGSAISGVLRDIPLARQMISQYPIPVVASLLLYSFIDFSTSAVLQYENSKQYAQVLSSDIENQLGSLPANYSEVTHANQAGLSTSVQNFINGFCGMITSGASWLSAKNEDKIDLHKAMLSSKELIALLESNPAIFERPEVMKAMGELMTEAALFNTTSAYTTLDLEAGQTELVEILQEKVENVYLAISKANGLQKKDQNVSQLPRAEATSEIDRLLASTHPAYGLHSHSV